MEKSICYNNDIVEQGKRWFGVVKPKHLFASFEFQIKEDNKKRRYVFMKKAGLFGCMLAMALTACANQDSTPTETPKTSSVQGTEESTEGGKTTETPSEESPVETQEPTEEVTIEPPTEETDETAVEDETSYYEVAAQKILDLFEEEQAEGNCFYWGQYFMECTTYVTFTEEDTYGEGDFGAIVVSVYDGGACITDCLSVYASSDLEIYFSANPQLLSLEDDATCQEAVENAYASRSFAVCADVKDYIVLDTTVEYKGESTPIEGAIYWLSDGSVRIYAPAPANFVLIPKEVYEDGRVRLVYIDEYGFEPLDSVLYDLRTGELTEE